MPAQTKISFRDVKQLIKWGEQNEVVASLIKGGAQPSLYETGYYWPSNANWAYIVGVAVIDGKAYELLTRFGSVEGGREIYIPTHKIISAGKTEMVY
ncbi:MAG TPA: hypothetical protein VN081_04455 [Dongiaceae bacterium]|nr:hypothetical protein [Dongiaceae bacterium]